MTAPHLQQRPESVTTTDENETTNNTSYKPPAVNRNWLSNLINQHSTDPRLTPYTKSLHKSYPILKSKALTVAPMVDQSDLPFRLLCRNYNSNLCFTPMVHAKMFTNNKQYRTKFWKEVRGCPPEDRPLIVQLCGSDVEQLLFTIRYILENKGSGVDGFDLNCGCPQKIAKKGRYGAFLLEKEGGDTIVNVVRSLVKEVGEVVPISVKVRILPSGVEDSLRLYERLVDAGAAMLTIHGRTRLQKGLETGEADWDAIKRAVELVGDRIPVMSNGSIGNLDEVRECLEYTRADGIMSSEAVLEYAPVFTETGTRNADGRRTGPGRLELAREYLRLSEKYPPEDGGQGNGIKCVRVHLHRMLHADLCGRDELRMTLTYAKDHEVLWKVCDEIEAIHKAESHVVENESLSWYMRHRKEDKNGVSVAEKRNIQDRHPKQIEEEGESPAFIDLFGNKDEEQCW